MSKTQEQNKHINSESKNIQPEVKGDNILAKNFKRHTNRYHKFITSPQWMALGVLFIGLSVFFYTNHLFFKYKETQYQFYTHINEKKSVYATTLSDGSIVCLGENSVLKCTDKFNNNNRIVDFTGNALFNIVPHEFYPFIIETDKINIHAIGTKFIVNNACDSVFNLSVKQGLVQIINKVDGQSYYVRENESIAVNDENEVLISAFDGELFNSYLRNIRFDNETLNNIIHIINLDDSISVRLSNSARKYGEQRLSIEFENNTPNEIIGMLSNILQLDYIQNEGSYVLLD